ncbi:MAG: F0F1 ATP synthase subunit epsilon [Planctomycetota bacterium]
MSDDRLKLKILTAEGVIEEGEYDKVVAPGYVGQFGVLPGHIAFITPLDVGEVKATPPGGEGASEKTFAVHGGFCEVQENNVLVLATAAEPKEEIDAERAKRAEQRARDRLSDRKKDDIDTARAETALKRALVRLQVHSGETD